MSGGVRGRAVLPVECLVMRMPFLVDLQVVRLAFISAWSGTISVPWYDNLSADSAYSHSSDVPHVPGITPITAFVLVFLVGLFSSFPAVWSN